MKTIIRNLKLWIIAVAAVASAACSDLLDQRPQGQWTIDDIEGGAYFSQVMALYTKARHYNITSGIPAFAVHYYRSEDSRKGSTTTDGAEHVPMYENFQYSAANSLLNPYWTQNYEIINAANTVLDQMQKAQEAGEQLDEAELQCGMEARFFRGWCYFNLVRAFGEVPLVDFAITNSDEANIPKSSVDKIYELIDADLTAAEGLPRRWESKYIGRVTYGAARALHAKTYGQRGLWSQMYQAAKNVIDTRVYNLDTPFDEIFREEGENSSESVWELQCTATVAQPATNDLGSQFCQVQGCRGSGTSNLGWGWHMADQSIVDVFAAGDPRREGRFIHRQRGQPAAGLRCQLQQPGQIARLHRSNNHHDETPATKRAQARSTRSSPLFTSSSLTFSAGAKRTTLAPAIRIITPSSAARLLRVFAFPAQASFSTQPSSSPRPRISLNRP